MTDWRTAFEQLVEDGRLSRSERKALRALVETAAPSDAERVRLRALAFEVAQEALSAANASAVLAWIEDVVSLLDAASDDVAGPDVVHEAWFSPGTAPLRAIQGAIRETRRSMDLCVFTITDDRIVAVLEEAVRRRVEVRIVSDDDKRRDLGSDLDRLARSGATVRLDRTPDHMHHKFGIFDGKRLLTGSYNWTRSAERGNSENVLVTSEPALVAAYGAEFERVWRAAEGI
ncbi:MAG: phospholipase D-like domain-containing protein [Planctomycetota bacterium]|nr:phospholipase D-like domain-containing protein [Planctomycetota bacterium]